MALPSRRSLSESEPMSGHPNASVVALFFVIVLRMFMSHHHTLHFTCPIVSKKKRDFATDSLMTTAIEKLTQVDRELHDILNRRFRDELDVLRLEVDVDAFPLVDLRD